MDLDDLIAAERSAPSQATAEQAEHVWQALERSMLAAPIAPPLPAGGAEVSALSKFGAALSTTAGKAVLAATLLAGGGATVATLQGEPQPQAPERKGERVDAARPVPQDPANPSAPRPPAAVPAPAPAPRPTQAPTPSSAAGAAADTPRSAAPLPAKTPPQPAPPEPAASLSDEMRLIQQAQQALQRGEPKATLAALAEHKAAFPQGSMREDREALQILAACKYDESGDTTAASNRAAAVRSFRRQWPRSLFLSRITAACE